MLKVKMKIIFLVLFLFSLTSGESYNVNSPDGNIDIHINVNDSVTYQVDYKKSTIIDASKIQMKLKDKILGKEPKVDKIIRSSKNETISPVVQVKSKKVKNHYNQLKIEFNNSWALLFRAYNDGVAYRHETNIDDEIKIYDETINYHFADNHKTYYPIVDSIYTHQEPSFKKMSLGDITSDSLACLPSLVKVNGDINVLVSEADLYNYPGFYLIGDKNKSNSLSGKLVGYPAQTKQINDRNVPVTEYADFIAKTNGDRKYPWRYIIIEEEEKDLLTSQMTYKLSSPLRMANTDWIEPGKVAWDWWNALNVYNVSFKAGINTQTYKHYIDFASENDLKYIILDEGWSNTKDLFDVKPEIDLEEIINYGKKKDVGVILWMLWPALNEKMDKALQKFDDLGVKGLKVDFMQRDDQKMVNFYRRVAKKAAEHELLVDFHGNYKPSGLRRSYPNVITREGVLGLEHNKWERKASPHHNVVLPFTRMVVGPMDYTPGAMNNATEQNFHPRFTRPMGQGTRAHQLGMYVIYESPLQMLADTPTNYKAEPECMAFLSQVPTTWDKTKALHGKVGEYVAMARKKGEKWYIGAMNDRDSTKINIDLSFLDSGEYNLKLYKDGLNADRNANDYTIEKNSITNDSSIKIQMAPGGGAAGIIEKK